MLFLKKVILPFFLFLTFTFSENTFHHYSYLGNYPTGVPIKKFHLNTRVNLSPGGVVPLVSSYGLGEFFSFGGSWGIDSLISNNDLGFFLPQITLKYTLFFENDLVPAISIGYEDFGKQNSFFETDQNDYFKSPGFYLVATKYFYFINRPFSLTAGINYSFSDNQNERYDVQLEPGDSRFGDNDFINGYVASDFIISDIFSIYGIYDLALDDNFSHNPFNGYLNFGFRLHFNEIILTLEWQDLLQNNFLFSNGIGQRQPFRREIGLTYLKHI